MVSLPSGVCGRRNRTAASLPTFCRRSMPNEAHKEESPGGWTDHSHCPWLSRLSRGIPRNALTKLDRCGGIDHAHICAGSGNGSPAFRKANIIGAHYVDQRAASGRDHELGACIAGVQARLKSGEFSRAGRAELECEILKLAHLRYTALHDFRKLGK